jgi:conjugal transfer/type IV secretion protein DotA/TraY
MNTTVRTLIFAALALLAAALPVAPPAHAQVTGTAGGASSTPSRAEIETGILRGSIPSGDYTAQVLFSIFPSLLGTSGAPNMSGGASTVGPETIAGIPTAKVVSTLPMIVGVFNICVLVLTIIILSYQGIVWVIDIGRTGKWDQDGGGFSSVWSPIRMALGLLLMVPVPGGPGWNAAQYAIATMAHAGYNGGLLVWEKAVALSGSNTRTPLIPPINPALPNTVALIGMGELCRLLVDGTERLSTDSQEALMIWRITQNAEEKKWRTAFNQAAKNPTARVFDGKCGEIILNREVTSRASNPRSAPILNPNVADAQARFAEMNFVAHDAAITATLGLAQRMGIRIVAALQRNDPDLQTRIGVEIEAFMRDGVITYANALQQTSSQILANLTSLRGREADFERMVSNAGWTNAGYFLLTYSNLSASAANVARVMPTVTGPRFDEMVGPRGRDFLHANATGGVLLAVRKEIARFVQPASSDWYMAATGQQSGVQGRGEGSAVGNAVSSAITSGSVSAASWMRRLLDPTVTGGGGWNPNPIATQIELGHTLINIALPILAIGAAAEIIPFGKTISSVGAGIAGFFTGGPATAAIAAASAGFAMTLAIPILMLGILYAYIIPMIVWAMWGIFVLGWVMLLVEAVLVASLWALSHARMDGNAGLTDHSKHGMGVIFSLVTRPAIGTIAIIIGLLIYTLIVTAASNAVYQYMIPSMTADNTFGPIGVIVVLGMVGLFQVALLIWILNLPSIISENLNAWLGMSAGPTYRTAESVGKITSMASGAGAAELTSTGGQAIKNAISAAGSKVKGSGADRGEAADSGNLRKQMRSDARGEAQAPMASSGPPTPRNGGNG